MRFILILYGIMWSMLFITGCAKTNLMRKVEMRKMTDQELQQVRDAFDQRVAQAFEVERGKPLVRAAKRPPLTPTAGNFVRHYSWSIMDFAIRCFMFNERVDEANAALVENAQHYIDNPKDIGDIDSFHWHSEVLCRLIEFYGTNGSIAPGRLKPETEAIMMEPLWLYADKRVDRDESNPRNTYAPLSSDNHHTMHFISKWHFAKLAKDHPLFKDRKYRNGSTAAEQYQVWNEYVKAYCLDHAQKGLFAELGSDQYNTVGTKGFYNVFDFADDPEAKRLAGNLLDLHWAMWAQEQIDGVRGGGRSRIYQPVEDCRGNSDMRQLAWFYFGIGQARRAASPFLPALTSAWRPPLVVIDLALDVQGRGRYEVTHRPIGLSQRAYLPKTHHLYWPDTGKSGSLVCYSWCTPDFILGTPMTEPISADEWPNVSAQNRWHGVIFAGDVDARIVPQARAQNLGPKKLNPTNAQWSVQRKGSLICQKLRVGKGAEEMRIWFSQAGLSTPTLQGDWVFATASGAYAAVRIIAGGMDLGPSQGKVAGQWLQCRDEWSPVILEVASKSDFSSYEAFQSAVCALQVSFENNVLNYQGLSGDKFTFYADQTKNPEVNGLPVDYAPPKVLDSPFLQSDWGSGVVTIAKNGRKAVLDFNEKPDGGLSK